MEMLRGTTVSNNDLTIWNLHAGVPLRFGAQDIVNIVGRLSRPAEVAEFCYSLNDAPKKPIAFRRTHDASLRLVREGDFNIDTIDCHDIRPRNTLTFFISRTDNTSRRYTIDFPARPLTPDAHSYSLDLQGVDHPQEVAQIVDGHWKVVYNSNGERCITIAPEDAGYDRIILFDGAGHAPRQHVRARLRVVDWTRRRHNVGLLFRWQSHAGGDGYDLPTRWSTGLGYYYSHSRGLMLRFGVDVHYDSNGVKLGDYCLADTVFSSWRHAVNVAGKLARRAPVFPQLTAGREYFFELCDEPDYCSLTVWPVGREQPAPQLFVPDPPKLLPPGAFGVIAHYCSVEILDFEISRSET